MRASRRAFLLAVQTELKERHANSGFQYFVKQIDGEILTQYWKRYVVPRLGLSSNARKHKKVVVEATRSVQEFLLSDKARAPTKRVFEYLNEWSIQRARNICPIVIDHFDAAAEIKGEWSSNEVTALEMKMNFKDTSLGLGTKE